MQSNLQQPRNSSRVKKLGPLFPGERINSASIEYGRRVKEKSSQVLGLRLFTNRGRGLIARALHSEPDLTNKTIVRDGVEYENVSVLYLDVPFSLGSIKGFFGRSNDNAQSSRIWRLGLVWGRIAEEFVDDTAEHFGDTGNMIDSEDLALLQKDQTTDRGKLTAAQNDAQAAQKKLEAAQKVGPSLTLSVLFAY